MPRYAVAGTVVDVDLELPELQALPPAGARTADWTVRAGLPAPDGDLETVFELRTDAGVLWGSLAAGEGRYRLAYTDLVAFHVDVEAATVTYVPAATLEPATLRHLLVDQAFPHLLAIGGALVLHASCVGVDGQAIAFVGPTGMGKSSLAAGFVREGASLLADDYVLLNEHDGGYLATPAYPGLRLWGDSAAVFAGSADGLPQVAEYTSKRRWAAPDTAHAEAQLPLAALVAPGNEPEPGRPECLVGRIRGTDAFMVLYQQAFRMERAGRVRQEAELERFSRLAARVPVLLVEYRRDYALLPQVIEDILSAVAAESDTAL